MYDRSKIVQKGGGVFLTLRKGLGDKNRYSMFFADAQRYYGEEE